MGAGYALRLAAEHPDRVLGAVYVGASVPVLERAPEVDGAERPDDFEDPLPTDDGWAKYNAHYWRRDWPGFAEFFAARVFSEAHTTKHREDFVGWMLETDPETIIATERASEFALPDGWAPGPPSEGAAVPFTRRVRCPGLVIHGDADAIMTHATGERLAALLGAPLVTVAGGGHAPQGREPVLVNRLIAAFARRVAAGERAR
jgi:pimeloyl-ACP methyl ester carboxylesterase